MDAPPPDEALRTKSGMSASGELIRMAVCIIREHQCILHAGANHVIRDHYRSASEARSVMLTFASSSLHVAIPTRGHLPTALLTRISSWSSRTLVPSARTNRRWMQGINSTIFSISKSALITFSIRLKFFNSFFIPFLCPQGLPATVWSPKDVTMSARVMSLSMATISEVNEIQEQLVDDKHVIAAKVEANGHMQLAEQVPLPPLRLGNNNNTKRFTKWKEFRTKQTREQHASKAREKYESDRVRINSYTARSTLVQGQDLEKIYSKLERAQQTVQINENDYAQFTRVLQETQFMWSYVNAVSAVCVSDDERFPRWACEGMRLALEQMEPEKEMDNFVHDYGTGNAIPEPPTFVNYANTGAPPVNHNRIMTHLAVFGRVTQRVMKPVTTQDEDVPFKSGANHAGVGAGGGPLSRGALTEADLSRSATHKSQRSQANGINGHVPPSHEPSVQQRARARRAQRRNGTASGLVYAPSHARTYGHARSQSYPHSQTSSATHAYPQDPVDPTVSGMQLVIGNKAWDIDPSKDPRQQTSGSNTTQATSHTSPPVGIGAGDEGTREAEHRTQGYAKFEDPSEALSTPASGGVMGYQSSGDAIVGSYPLACARPSSPNPPPPTAALAALPSRAGASSASTSSGMSGSFMPASGVGAGMPPPSSASGGVPVEQVVANYWRPFPGEPRSRANSFVGSAPPPVAMGQPPSASGVGQSLGQSPQQMQQQDPGPRSTSRAGYPGIGTTSLAASAPSPARGTSPGRGIGLGGVQLYGKARNGFRELSPAVGRSPSPQPPRGQHAPTYSYTDGGRLMGYRHNTLITISMRTQQLLGMQGTIYQMTLTQAQPDYDSDTSATPISMQSVYWELWKAGTSCSSETPDLWTSANASSVLSSIMAFPQDLVSGGQYRYALTNFCIAHENVEEKRCQLEEQEQPIGLLHARIALLEGTANSQDALTKQGGTSVDAFSIKLRSYGPCLQIWTSSTQLPSRISHAPNSNEPLPPYREGFSGMWRCPPLRLAIPLADARRCPALFSTLKSPTSTSYPLSFVSPVQTTLWSAQMSSSSSYRPSHLHRVNLQSNGKRPFEEYGYDSDPDPSSLNSGTQPSIVQSPLLPHSTFTEGIPETPSVSSEDNLRSSLQRFNEFERHIAALRSSIATSRRSLLPQMGSSEHATHEDWHAGPSTFQSMNSGGFTARDTSDESNGKDDTFSSMSSFGSTNGISTTHLSAPSTGSRLYPFQYNNLSPPYSPMSGGPSAEGERSGGTIGSSHVLPGMEGTRANVGIRRPSDSRLSPPPPPPQLRPTRGSPSPLVLESAVSPSSSDDTSLASNGVIGSDLCLPVTRGRRDNISPAGFFERQAGELSHQFGTGDDRLTTDHLIDAESQLPPNWLRSGIVYSDNILLNVGLPRPFLMVFELGTCCSNMMLLGVASHQPGIVQLFRLYPTLYSRSFRVSNAWTNTKRYILQYSLKFSSTPLLTFLVTLATIRTQAANHWGRRPPGHASIPQ
ncbi:hypothetical protein EDD15DRAFT_2473073 [Pisolithus albus]|nr:hypothetical protein EDD15DRAFT_2473073 [Pisolithus albus]